MFGEPRRPAIDAVFTMAPPPRARISGATTFIPSQTALRLTAITWCERLFGIVDQRFQRAEHARVVEEDVDAAEPLHGRVGVILHLRQLRHVGLDGVHLAVDLLDRGHALPERRRGQIDDHHARALGREAHGGGAPNAAGASGDEHDLPSESRRHVRRHLALGADSTQAWGAMTEDEG